MAAGRTSKRYLRCKDLIDTYKPDLVYFDNFDFPLGQTGLDTTAHYYNASMQWHGGKLEAFVNTKTAAGAGTRLLLRMSNAASGRTLFRTLLDITQN